MGTSHYIVCETNYLAQHRPELIEGIANFLCIAWGKKLITEEIFDRRQPSAHVELIKKGKWRELADVLNADIGSDLILLQDIGGFQLDPSYKLNFCKTGLANQNGQNDLIVALCFLVQSMGNNHIDFASDSPPEELKSGAKMFIQVVGKLPLLSESSPDGVNTQKFKEYLLKQQSLMESVSQSPKRPRM